MLQDDRTVKVVFDKCRFAASAKGFVGVERPILMCADLFKPEIWLLLDAGE